MKQYLVGPYIIIYKKHQSMFFLPNISGSGVGTEECAISRTINNLYSIIYSDEQGNLLTFQLHLNDRHCEQLVVNQRLIEYLTPARYIHCQILGKHRYSFF